jgi:hypothetical protein
MNQHLLEKHTIKQIIPQSLNASALTGTPRIKVEKGFRVAIVASMGDSTAAVVEFALKQHNAATAGTTKALEIAAPYYHKAGAATVFTKVEPTVAADTYTLSSVFADAEGVVVFEVLAEDLDVNGGFAWISLEIAAPTAAKVFAVHYQLHEVKYAPAYELAI